MGPAPGLWHFFFRCMSVANVDFSVQAHALTPLRILLVRCWGQLALSPRSTDSRQSPNPCGPRMWDQGW